MARFQRSDALIDRARGVRLTYGELWNAVERVARGLMAFGIEKGDRVGIWSPNRYEWVLVQYATARIGAVLVTVNPPTRRTNWPTPSTSRAFACW